MEITTEVFQILKLTGIPLKSGEIADKTGLDKKEVDKAIKQLLAEDKIVSPRRCFYGIKI